MRQTTAVLMMLFVALGAILGGCSAATTPAPTVPVATAIGQAPTETAPAATQAEEAPVVMRIGASSGPDCLNPFACGSFWFFLDFVYEGFNGYGADCNVAPRLAESMEVSEDGRTWTLHLREGATYSNGEPFDAQAVKAFWDWYTSTSLKDWYLATSLSDSWEATDDHTFRFTTEEPVGAFPVWDAFWLFPLPATLWGEFDDTTLYGFENADPIGTGPYVLTEYAPGDHLIYDARPDYWGGPPAVDRIVIQIFANWDAQIQALLAGEIDVTDRTVPASYYDPLTSAPNVSVIEKDVGYKYYLAFNLAENGNKHPAVEDLAVRTAIDFAIDKQQLIDVALLGHGLLCPTSWVCVPYGEQVTDPSLSVTPFDLARANAILEEAGYLDTNGDDVRESKDGETLRLRLFYNSSTSPEIAMSQMISEWLSQIGIATDVEAQEEGTLFSATRELQDFDLAIIHLPDELDPGAMDIYFSCWSAEAGAGGFNDSGYCSPEMDELISRSVSLRSTEERRQVGFEIGRLINRDRPVINLAEEKFIQAYRNDRFVYQEVGCTTMAGLWDWYSIMHVEPAKK